MKNIKVGLCEGRHKMLVQEYVFSGELYPAAIEALEAQAKKWVSTHCKSADVLTVYVTGLTVALTSLIKACELHGVFLRLMHYDLDSGGYIRQDMYSTDHMCRPCHRCGADTYYCPNAMQPLATPEKVAEWQKGEAERS